MTALTVMVSLVGVDEAAAIGAGSHMVRPGLLAPSQPPSGSVALGAVSAASRIPLSFVLPPSHGDQLRSLLTNLYNPASPEYHHWLRPGQFLADFGPSPVTVSAVRAWLKGVGLDATASGFTVRVSAPAGRLAPALGTSFERYRSPSGEEGYLAHEAPLVPQSLAGGQVVAVLGLSTVSRFQAPSSSGSALAPNDGTAVQPHADGLTACAAAQATAGSQYLTLDQVGAAYGIGALLANGQNGRGKTIGLYELGDHSASDVAAYESCFGLSNPVSTVAVDGGADSDNGYGTIEADLDIESAVTQAPGASIISYEAPANPTAAYDDWNTIVSQDAVQVVSTSWGECEPIAQSVGEISSFTPLFEQAAAQGQTVIAATGDYGAEDCSQAGSGDTSAEVDFPASDAWVLAVGGTTLSNNGPEVVWNACQSEESTACAATGQSGGGGSSRYVTRPGYQPDVFSWPSAQPCGQQCREVPDISANSGTPMVYFSYGNWDSGGGTSFAAPFMAGLVADKDVGCTGLTGLFAPALYALYDEGAYGTAFTDITSGDNDLTGSNGGNDAALPGYDAASGIGSPLAAGLSCPEVTSVGTGASGTTVAITGLGLERATVSFGGRTAQVVSSSATEATVVVPSGSGTVRVSATSAMGTGTEASAFTYPGPTAPSSPVATQHGYWLVGSDGGIFTFGSAAFYGSTGALVLQRPVVGITPTADDGGYWLVASDGGIFTFGDAGFYGSIPGIGLAPAGSSNPKRLNAPIVGMVPSNDGRGYFMVASDGGVFTFGDARFAGSCPAIGGCSGAAVAVMPDLSGNGYWLVTSTGNVYAFGDAVNYGAPGQQSVPVTAAARTADGMGYWLLFSNGAVAAYGDAVDLGAPLGALSGSNPATAIFTTSDGGGYWVATADGSVFAYGDAPNDGDMAEHRLNGLIVAATGW